MRIMNLLSGIAKAPQCKHGHSKLAHMLPHQLFISVMLILDRHGCRDKTLEILARYGICESASAARKAITKAAKVINADLAFKRTDEQRHAVLWLGDNADIRKWGTCWSFIAVCVVCIGFDLSPDEVHAFDAGMGLFPELSTDHCADMAMSPADANTLLDECLHPTNIYKLLVAAVLVDQRAGEHNGDEPGDGIADAAHQCEFAKGDEVTFRAHGYTKRGCVHSTDGQHCSIVETHGTGEQEIHESISVVASDVQRWTPAGGGDGRGSAGPHLDANDSDVDVRGATSDRDEDSCTAHDTSNYQPGSTQDDDGEFAPFFPPSYTLTTDQLADVSSKHSDATHKLLHRMKQSAQSINPGTKAISTDFEFYNSLALSFFVEDEAVVPIPAFGHLSKCVVASTFKTYEQVLQPNS